MPKSTYSTLDYIEDLRKEVSKLVPDEIQRGNVISYDQFSKYIGMNSRYIRDTRTRMKTSTNPKYNPNFKFTKSQLNYFLQSLSDKLIDRDLSRCTEINENYIKNNKILDYEHQQWHLHNPDLNVEFFKKMDNPNNGYYFGLLLGDGTSSSYNLGLWLEKSDFKIIERYRKDLGISNKIETIVDTRQRKQSGEFPVRIGIRLGCIPLIGDLRTLGYFRFKNGDSLEEGFFTNLREDVALSVLLGFYDADGDEGAPVIRSTNKKFLGQIKNEFNIKYDVRLKKKAEKGVVVLGKVCDTVDQYYLRFSPDLFNKMMESNKYSMERKREHYPMEVRGGRYAYDRLVDKVPSKEMLKELVLIGPRIKLAEHLGCTFELFKRLCDASDIEILRHSYWKREENKDWDTKFKKKVEEVEYKYFCNQT